MKKHKILIIHLSIYQNFLLAKGLSELGHTAGVYYNDNPKNDFLLDHWENFNYTNNSLYKTYQIKPKSFKRHALQAIIYFVHFIFKYDTFIYMAPMGILQPLLSWGKEIAILKHLKKNILIGFSGAADIGTPLLSEPDFQIGDQDKKNEILNVIAKYNLKTMGYGTVLHNLQNFSPEKNKKRHNFWSFNLMDIKEWSKFKKIPIKYKINKKPGFTYVYHSFGNGDTRQNVKGTMEIKQATENLKNKGHKVELIYFEKMPNKNLKYYQFQADIVIDQLKEGWHGQTAAECMALSKPIILYQHEDVKKLHPKPSDIPFINATVLTIESILEYAINHPEEMKKIGEKTRKYCRKYYDYLYQCKKILQHLYGK